MTEKVWWFRPGEDPETPLASICPWGDYQLRDPSDKSIPSTLGILNNYGSGNVPFGEKDGPTAFYIKSPPRSGHLVPQNDFNIGYTGSYVITEAMHTLLSEFDLGDTQLIELPLYDGKKIPTRVPRMYDVQPDFDKPLPGRWFLLHVTARKNSFSLEASSGFVQSKPSEPQHPNVPYQDDLRVVVDRSALSGCDLWREATFSSSYFFLSDRLKSALTASSLRIGKISFYPCALI